MSRDFRILDWVVHPELNRIQSGDETIQLEPKIMQVLMRLAESSGEVVTREALLESVWEGTFVSDDVLTRSVVELRKIFGDDSRKPRIIETIPKRGYRLIPPVVVEPETAEAPAAEIPLAREQRSDVWGKRAVGLAILFVAALGSLALFGYFTAETDVVTSPPSVFPLTSSSGNEYDPAVSPDGHQVAFAWIREGEETEDIYVRQLQSETPLRLTDHPDSDRQPRWSPDGQRIAFVRGEGADCTIYIIPSIGGAEKKLVPCGNTRYPAVAWSSDGEWLVLAKKENQPDAPLHLQLVSVSTLERRDLTGPPDAFWGDHTAAFSPDGKWIAFIRSRIPGIEDINVVSTDGGEPRRVTLDNRDITGLAWSPDGRSIVFSSNRAGTYSLWKVRSDGGEPEWITGGGMKLKDPAVARRADRIAFEGWVYEINIWQVPVSNTSGEGARPIITSTQWDRQPHLSPDGREVAFVSTRSGSSEIWKSNADGSNLVQLTSLGGPHTSQPRWSPDGESLVYVSRPEGQADLYVINASATPPRRLTSHPLDEMAPSWSADGEWIYFGSRRSGRWEIWKIPAGGGEAQQVTTDGGYAALEAPDGSSIYYVKSDVPGIWRAPPDGSEETIVVEGYSPEAWGSWAVTLEGLYLLTFTESGLGIGYRDFTTGRTRSIAPVPNFMPHGLTVSPDGIRILYAQTDRQECDVMIGDGLLRGSSGPSQ
jgi:Tol biopolymer transport system component/DNA-binding winged helix-turn-helix (wHTH) protein